MLLHEGIDLCEQVGEGRQGQYYIWDSLKVGRDAMCCHRKLYDVAAAAEALSFNRSNT